MSITVQWYVEGRIVLIQARGIITPSDIRASREPLLAYLRQGTPPIHIIYDGRYAELIQPRVVELRRAFSDTRLEAVGWEVLILHNSILRLIGSILFQMMNADYTIVRSPEAALAFLEQHDKTLGEVS
ncbi:MAG: hypothetical protein SF029_00850 [bacterium]|nr:hypothetical protein [bacterium]